VEKLVDRYAVPNIKCLSRKEFDRFRVTIQIRVCNVLLLWTKRYPAGFLHPITGVSTCNLVVKFLDEIIATDHLNLAKQIRKNVLNLLRVGQEFTKQRQPFFRNELSMTEEGNNKALTYSALEIAEQLTVIEWYFFSHIMVFVD
jgi:hypothetical protein